MQSKGTAGVKRVIERLMRDADWCDAGQGWHGAETRLRLSGWSRGACSCSMVP